MRGSALTKIVRLAKHIAFGPVGVGRYIRYRTSQPLEIGLPWFSWPAIDFLDGFVQPGTEVFEYGGGGSTVFFAEHGATVTVMEDQAVWCDRIVEALKVRGLAADVRSLPVNPARVDLFAASGYVNGLDKPYKVIVVDGIETTPAPLLRPICFAHAESLVERGGIIVVDDAWRYDGAFTSNRARARREFEGVGPGRNGVTRTDIYYY